MRLWQAGVLAGAMWCGSVTAGHLQAQQASTPSDAKAQQLLDQMVKALGGDAWLHRNTWTAEGRVATFYKGRPNEGVIPYEEYHREDPYASRIVIVSHSGVFIPTAKRDIQELWVGGTGWEITYRGKKELPKEVIGDYEMRRRHSLEAVMQRWVKAPGVVLVYAGTTTVARHLADEVTVLSADNDAVTIDLDAATHLPLDTHFEVRNEQYRDHDSYREEYDDYHDQGGVMTALTITRYKNDDMTSQRYITKIAYGAAIDATLFDPDRPLTKKK